MTKFRVEYMESERGWGQDYWHVDYNTHAEALDAFNKTNAKNTSPIAPDYYIQAISITEVKE